MHEIPQAKPTDAEDVAWGLQTAASLWNRGERSDAVAWLRRAAQAASDAEDDDRALELARVAAELADFVGTQGTMMPGAPAPPESVPVAVEEGEESTAVNALPPSQDPAQDQPASSTPSVPPADKVHAGMFDPWSEPPPPGAAPSPHTAAVPPPPPIVNIPIPAAPITQPMFGEEEVVTSAKTAAVPAAALPSKPAPPRPPPLPPGASRKPPPLPPRALAKKPQSEPSQQAALPVSADLLGVTRPPPAPETAPLPIAEPRFPTPPPPPPPPPIPPAATPPPPSPTQQHAVFAGQAQSHEREDDEESSAETTPPPPVQAADANEPDDMAPTPIAPAVAARAARASEAPTEEPKPVPVPAPADDRPKLDLENVDAFSDLPDDARAEFAAAGEVHVLAEGDETAGFALAYVMEGSLDVAATMVDAPAVRLDQGAVLRSRGTTNEGVPMRIIAASPRSVVATWSSDAVEAAFSNCPWVEEDLRAASDRVMTLVGITIGPLGERLDQSLREEIIGKLQVRPLIPGEIVVNKGEPVPGLVLVGVGELELVDGDDVKGIVGSGDFLFATEILGGGAAPYTARAGAGGALAMFGNRSVAQELMVTCPPLLEVFAGM